MLFASGCRGRCSGRWWEAALARGRAPGVCSAIRRPTSSSASRAARLSGATLALALGLQAVADPRCSPSPARWGRWPWCSPPAGRGLALARALLTGWCSTPSRGGHHLHRRCSPRTESARSSTGWGDAGVRAASGRWSGGGHPGRGAGPAVARAGPAESAHPEGRRAASLGLIRRTGGGAGRGVAQRGRGRWRSRADRLVGLIVPMCSGSGWARTSASDPRQCWGRGVPGHRRSLHPPPLPGVPRPSLRWGGDRGAGAAVVRVAAPAPAQVVA